jgi:hypothetical protein
MSKRTQKRNAKRNLDTKSKPISYRLKCTKTANGLSHFVMYGDASKEKTLL